VGVGGGGVGARGSHQFFSASIKYNTIFIYKNECRSTKNHVKVENVNDLMPQYKISSSPH
jgi:hypothetical protein